MTGKYYTLLLCALEMKNKMSSIRQYVYTHCSIKRTQHTPVHRLIDDHSSLTLNHIWTITPHWFIGYESTCTPSHYGGWCIGLIMNLVVFLRGTYDGNMTGGGGWIMCLSGWVFWDGVVRRRVGIFEN